MDYEVIIAGGSFAGLATAAQLYGRRVMLIEPRAIGAVQTSACGTLLAVLEATGTMDSLLQVHDQFIQTQLVYDVTAFQRGLEALAQRGLLAKLHVLAGIGPLHSIKTARFLNERVPGVFVPERLIERLEQSPSPEQTGNEIALELIQQVKALPGVAGIHVMCLGRESLLPRLLDQAGLDIKGAA